VVIFQLSGFEVRSASWQSDSVDGRDIEFGVDVFLSEHGETVLTHSSYYCSGNNPACLVFSNEYNIYIRCYASASIERALTSASSRYMLYVKFNLLCLYILCCTEAFKYMFTRYVSFGIRRLFYLTVLWYSIISLE